MAWSTLDAKGQEALTAATAEAGALRVGLNDAKNAELLVEFRANAALAVNERDRDAFRAATASVCDKWEAKEFGDVVKSLRAAAA